MKKKVLLIILYTCIWLAFLSLPYLFKPDMPDRPKGSLINDLFLPTRLANEILLICLFYFNYHVAIPKFYIPRKYLQLTLSFIVSFIIYLLLNHYLAPRHMHGGPTPLSMSFGHEHHFFMFIIVYICSFTLSIYAQLQKEKEEKLNTEISFLKAQINPHFLFNTLNSIYSLALAKSDKTPDAVVKLSGMMRYAVSDSAQDHVSLAKELTYISNYIDLQKMRIPDKVKIRYSISGDITAKEIAPFMLIPFIENAFKYGINSEEDSDIRISIDASNNTLLMDVINNKVFVHLDKEASTGLGIKNTISRLQILYPNKHELKITENDNTFEVSLKLILS